MGVALVTEIPITDAAVVVPVPIFVVRFLTVFIERLAATAAACIPKICEEAPVADNCIELATVPPTRLLVAFQTFDVDVFARIP